MSSISFTAHGRCARATYCEPITTGSVGLSASFAFDAAWSGLQKTAIFRGSGMAVDLVLSGDAATVPPEVLTIPGGDLRVGVWGADPDGNVIIPTVWATVGEIVPGAAPSGFDPDPPTPSWAAQVQEIAQDALDTANSVREDADAGEFDGATYTPAVSAGGDLSWTNDKGKPNPPTVNIKGPEGQPGQDAPDDYILVQPTEPTSETNALWINSAAGERVQLPTMADHRALAEAVADNTEAIGDLSDEVAQQKSAIEDLEALVDRKAGALIDTASGAIASFVPDSTIDNLLGVSVAVEPVQDLHGYDAPWPGGGSKNKLPSNATDTTYTRNGVTVTAKNGVYTLSGTATGVVSIDIPLSASVDLSPSTNKIAFLNNISVGQANIGFVRSGSGQIHFWSLNNINRVASGWTDTGNEVVDTLRIYVNSGTDVSGLIVSPMLLALTESDPTTFTPYSNLCPISGWSAVGIEAAGKNLIDSSNATRGLCGYRAGDTLDTVVASTRYSHSVQIPARGGLKLSYRSNDVSTFNQCIIECFVGRNWASAITGNAVSDTSTVRVLIVPANTYDWVKVMYSAPSGGVVGTNVDGDIQLETGSSATAFKPYTGNTYTIALGQTVYGGTLDAVNGVLTVDRFSRLGSDLTWQFNSQYHIAYTYVPGKKYGVRDNYMCSDYTIVDKEYRQMNNGETSGAVGDTGINVKNDAWTSLSDAVTALANVRFVFLLATPIELTLDPITISTISGQTNNVWADTGDVDVTYAADIKAYIDRMSQPTEDDMIANTLIAANKYFTVNNKLYLSTASIAAGAQIIPGTNCTETSLVEALNALNA